MFFKYVQLLIYVSTLSDCILDFFQVLQRILMGTDVVKNVNKNNASHAVLFEALALVIFYILLFSSVIILRISWMF